MAKDRKLVTHRGEPKTPAVSRSSSSSSIDVVEAFGHCQISSAVASME